MSHTQKRVNFVTSALPYVNNVPHLGNIIGSTLSADVYARFLRKRGDEVLFLCGTDEYGTTTEIKALKEGISCEEICGKYRKLHKQVYDWFNISFDIFGKTTTDTQTELAQEIFLTLWKKNLLISKMTEQLYCNKCDRFVCDRYINGKCYHANCNGITKGDQCDDCCNLIDLDKLQSKWCSVCGSTPEKKLTKHLYLKLNEFTEQIYEYFLNEYTDLASDVNSKFIKYMSNSSKGITKAWLSKPLEDRCITRDLKWGTPVPKVEGLEEYYDKVFYVWFDAPIGYLSILKNERDDWKKWISANWIQFMAKDNVPFHTIIFPATLLGSDLDIQCGVTHLSSTEYLTFEGAKFSKSNNVGIFGDKVIEISNKLGIDEDYWRYYLIKIRPERTDSVFKLDDFVAVIKGELAQKIGNLVNRSIIFCQKSYPDDKLMRYDFDDYLDTKTEMLNIFDRCIKSYENFEYHEVIRCINKMAELGNGWFNSQKLWLKCDNDIEGKDKHFVGNVGFIIWVFAELCEPIMPKKSEKIKSYFNIKNDNGNNLDYEEIRQKIIQGKGNLNVDYSDIKILFNQVKLDELTKLLKLS